jgi:hypothetical protein
MLFCGLNIMKIILSKEDIEEIIKKIFDIEAIGWNEDGSLTIDTVLEKLVNDKSKFNTDDLRRMLGRPVQPVPIPYNPSPPYINPNPLSPRPIWYSPMQPGQTTITNTSSPQGTITNPAGGSVFPMVPKIIKKRGIK